ncbi:MAG: NHLP leader peptide family RiPP precursor [Nostoc sp.]|uniref:NHLP leader peptide family RiPP precursor n=1 Tax=Nostoc sp. TaxID=1180 RepID=UPI002FF52C79
MVTTNAPISDTSTNFPEVSKLWSGVDITNFGPYYEALQTRLIDRIWNDESLKQEILTNPRTVFERETGITFPADTEVKVLEEPENTFYFVLPATPPVEEHWYRYEQFSSWWPIIDTFYYFYNRLGGTTKARAYRECLQALWIVRSWTLTIASIILVDDLGIKLKKVWYLHPQ